MDRTTNSRRLWACLHTVVLIAIISYVVLAGFGCPASPFKAHAETPLIDNASPTPTPEPDVYGFVYDSKGNKVPNAHITIYYPNGTFIWLKNNPTFSSSSDNLGYYGFFGVDIGNYTLRAEITDTFGDAHNGTARAIKFDDRSVFANVTIPGYVYSPWISPTPTPEPVAVQMPAATARPTMVPHAKEEQTSIFNPLYAVAATPVALVGALLIIRNKKDPVPKKGQRYIDMGRSQTDLRGVGKNNGWNINVGFSEYYLMNNEYSSELEELVQSTIKHHYNDIAMINRIENISKKYGIELTVVYRDVKKIKNTMERGRTF